MAIGDTINDDRQDGESAPPRRRLQLNARATWGRLLDVLLPPVCLGCDARLFEHDTLCPECWRGIDFIQAPLCDRLGIPLPYDTGGTMISAAAAADPPVCLGCDARLFEHDTLCPECWRGIDFISAPLCDRLGIPLPYDTGGTMISAAAAAEPPVYDRARAVARFDGLMRDLIHGLKFADTHDGHRLFGRWLMSAGADLVKDADVVVPVPLSRWRLLSRRFNQAQILAGEVARLAGKPVAATALIRHRTTKQQVGLTRAERKKNVAGAFSVTASKQTAIHGKSVLLIDDVITTGATVSAAARALRRAGAARVDVLALAIVSDPGHII